MLGMVWTMTLTSQCYVIECSTILENTGKWFPLVQNHPCLKYGGGVWGGDPFSFSCKTEKHKLIDNHVTDQLCTSNFQKLYYCIALKSLNCFFDHIFAGASLLCYSKATFC